MLCQARTEAAQCSLETFSTYHWSINIAMSGPSSLFGSKEEVMILLSSRDRAVMELEVGQRITVRGRLRPGDLAVTMIDSVASISLVS